MVSLTQKMGMDSIRVGKQQNRRAGPPILLLQDQGNEDQLVNQANGGGDQFSQFRRTSTKEISTWFYFSMMSQRLKRDST